jgi:hypothetical protein
MVAGSACGAHHGMPQDDADTARFAFNTIIIVAIAGTRPVRTCDEHSLSAATGCTTSLRSGPARRAIPA